MSTFGIIYELNYNFILISRDFLYLFSCLSNCQAPRMRHIHGRVGSAQHAQQDILPPTTSGENEVHMVENNSYLFKQHVTLERKFFEEAWSIIWSAQVLHFRRRICLRSDLLVRVRWDKMCHSQLSKIFRLNNVAIAIDISKDKLK